MMLVSDTTHSKVVVIYDIACHHCRENFAEYARLWHEMDTSQMRMYFVQTTCNDFPKVDELFASQNINPTLYYLLDDTPAFVATRKNEGRYLSIARYLCGRTDLTSPNGIPHYYHADRQGNITVSLSLGDLSAPKICTPEGKCNYWSIRWQLHVKKHSTSQRGEGLRRKKRLFSAKMRRIIRIFAA